MAGEEIEQDFLKDIKQVKLELDENQRITRIICDVNDEKFKAFPVRSVIYMIRIPPTHMSGGMRQQPPAPSRGILPRWFAPAAERFWRHSRLLKLWGTHLNTEFAPDALPQTRTT